MLTAIVIALILFCIICVISAKKESREMEHITHVSLIGQANVYEEKYEHTGVSIGTSGHGRAYFRKRKHLKGVESTFRVFYSDKPPKIIKVMENTGKYCKLISYIDRQELKAQNLRDTAPASAEEESVQTSAGRVLVEVCRTESKSPLDPPKFLDIPFEVLPNEYSLEVRHQSCIYKQTKYDNGRCEVDIRFEAYYDPTIKGVTNRKIVVSLYDQKGRIFAVSDTGFRRLDKSGCKVVSLNFWQDIIEEPSQVSISIEKFS